MQSIVDDRLHAAMSAAAPPSGAQDVQVVTASGVRSLEGIEQCGQLRRLVLEGGDIADLSPLGAIPQLEQLVLRYSRVGPLTALSGCRSIHHIEISFCSSEDLASLSAMSGLRTADLVGCPWADQEGRPQAQALRQRLERLWLSIDPDWRLCRRLHEASSGLVFGFRHGRWLLVRPGPATRPGAVCDCVVDARIDLVEEALHRYSARPSSVFAQVRALLGASPVPHPAQGAPIEEGDTADARSWLAALSTETGLRTALERWVEGFPHLHWFRRTEHGLAGMRDVHGLAIPAWYLAMQAALAGAEPTTISWVQLAGSGVDSGWFTLDLSKTAFHSCGALLRSHGLIPIAEARDPQPLFLAIRADGTPAHPVYAVDAHLDASTPLDRIPTPFGSYPALLDAITRIELEDGSQFSRYSSSRQ